MINRVILIGNLTRDTETFTGARSTVARLRLATNAVWRDAEGNRQESTEYHSVVAYGRLAEICGNYCVRGRRVYIEGRLRTRDYTGSDGLRRVSTEVVAETMKLLDRREGTEDVDDGPGEDAAATPGAAEPLAAVAS